MAPGPVGKDSVSSMESAPLLRRCPFCAGKAAFGTVRYGKQTMREQEWEQDTFHFVSCVLCGASNCGLVGHKNKVAASKHWNRRPR